MSILTGIRKQAAAWQQPKATKAVADYKPDLRYRVHESSGTAGEPIADNYLGNVTAYAAHTWVRKAVTLTAQNIAPLPVRVVDANDEAIDGHPLTVLLNAGNDVMTAPQVWEHYITSLLLAGEGLLEVVPDRRNQPLWLWPRRPDKVMVQPDMAPERRLYPSIAAFSVVPEDKDGVTVSVPVESMIFDKFTNPLNPWRGLSVIGAVRNSIVIDMYAQAWSKKFLQSGARPDYALVAPQGITQTERERLQAELMSRYGGPEGWHKPVILEQGITDVKAFSFPPKDIEWLAQREFSRDEIGAIFAVPDEIMGFGKNTYENFQTALTVFWTLALQPLVMRRDVALTHFFTVRNPLLQPGQRIATDLSTVGALQEDKAPKVAMAKTLWDMGAPFNQLDEQLQLGVGAIPNGEHPFGKDPAVAEAFRQVLSGNGNQAQDNADAAQDDDPEHMDNADDGDGAKGAATAHGFFIKGVNGLTRDTWLTAKALVLQTVPGDDDAEEELRRDLERQAEDAIIAGFRQQANAMIPRNASGLPLDALFAALAAGIAASTALHDAITRTVINGADAGVNIAIDQLASVGVGFDYTLVNQAAREWAAQYSGTLIRDIDAHTLEYVRATVARWYENGEPLSALRRDLEPIFGARRAQLIAQSETTSAAAEGAWRGYRESGVVTAMQWNTVRDERVCPVCGDLHDKIVDLNGSFWDTLPEQLKQRYPRTFQRPRAHPGCRCRLRPVVLVNE